MLSGWCLVEKIEGWKRGESVVGRKEDTATTRCR